MRSMLKKMPLKFQRNLLRVYGDQVTPNQGVPLLDQLLLTVEEQRDFDSFASPNTRPKGKTPLWKVSQENPQVYPRTQPQPLNNQVQPVVHTVAPMLFIQLLNQWLNLHYHKHRYRLRLAY